ncbi:MAG: sugar nucleotide-binding protein [Chloroflexi bacterium]|nr:sugar nucleotide-binding protein [Chloroflexota bacterium]
MKIYVTGGTGFLGSNIIKVAIERYQAQVFTNTHSWQPSAPVPFEYENVDICDQDQIQKTVDRFKPDAIIHCAALLDFARLYQDRRLAWEVYVKSTRYLTKAANKVGAKIILISSDWVFDGTQTDATETTPPNPVNYYGVLKVVGETVVAENGNNWAVARVSGVNGVHWLNPDKPLGQNAGFGYFAASVVNSLRQKQPFTVWEGNINMYATPSLASESADMMMRIIKLDKQGIFHCCCGQSVTRMELAQLTAEVFDLDASLIKAGPPDPTDPGSLQGYMVPRDTSLSATYPAEQLNYPLPDVRRLLQIYRRQIEMAIL